MKPQYKRRGAFGFTLVEILVAIAILTVLSALLLGVFSSVREKGRGATCQSNLRQLNLALHQYVNDNDATYPAPQKWAVLVLPYAKSTQLFECPSEPTAAPAPWSLSYQTDYEMNVEFLRVRDGKIWPGEKEAKFASIDATRLWTLADSDPEGRVEAHVGEVPSACGGVFIQSLIRHSGGSNFAFADGHVKWLNPQGFADIYCYLKTSLH